MITVLHKYYSRKKSSAEGEHGEGPPKVQPDGWERERTTGITSPLNFPLISDLTTCKKNFPDLEQGLRSWTRSSGPSSVLSSPPSPPSVGSCLYVFSLLLLNPLSDGTVGSRPYPTRSSYKSLKTQDETSRGNGRGTLSKKKKKHI